VYVSIPTVKGESNQSNLVVNGTFDSELTGSWAVYRVSVAEPYPIVRRERDASGEYYLYFDTPLSTEAYVQQGLINIPQSSKVLLSFQEWGWHQPTQISVEVVGSAGNTDLLDQFMTEGLTQLNGGRVTKTYDLTEFAGQSIYLKFDVTSILNSGTITGIADVRLVAADPLYPIIACGIAPQGSSNMPEYSVQSGQSVSVSGEIYPVVEMPLRIVYTSPSGAVATQEVAIGRGGSFNADFTPVGSGIWFVSISPTQFAGTDYLGSCNSQFVVRGPTEIDLLQIVVNGRVINISNPVIEVKPRELISGTVAVRTLDNLRFTNVVIIGFASWQPNAWDLVMYSLGLEGDPTGLGWKDGLMPEPPGSYAIIPVSGSSPTIISDSDGVLVPRDKNLGSYVFNATWSFPLSEDFGNEWNGQNGFYRLVSHPNMTAPSIPGQYYLVLIQDAVNSATELVQDKNAFTRTDWQKFIPPTRNATGIIAIPVLVVDVDSHLNAASNEIACANSYNANTGIAEGYYSQALQLASEGRYNASANVADEALAAATASVRSFVKDINPNKVDLLYLVSDNVVSLGGSLGNRNRISTEYDQFRSLFGRREYCQAKALQDDITSLTTSDSLAFIGSFLIAIFGIGNVAALIAEKIYPTSALEEKLRKMLRCKVSIHGLIAGLVAYGIIDVALTVFYSWFPPLGSLILVIGVAIGVWLHEEVHRTDKGGIT
jgi:hypothetical protein